MLKENIKALNRNQKLQLKLYVSESYYMLLPQSPSGGLEVSIVLQNGFTVKKITYERAKEIMGKELGGKK